MRGQTLATIDAVIIALVAIFLAVQLDLTAAAGNHYLVLHPCLFPTHMRVVFSVTKELVKVRIVFSGQPKELHFGRAISAKSRN